MRKLRGLVIGLSLLLALPAFGGIFGTIFERRGPTEKRCDSLWKDVSGRHGVGSDREFVQRLNAEKDPQARDFAVIIRDDVQRYGAMTEVGAHGNGLSWKWLGVATQGEGSSANPIVIGYANPQYYHAPYDKLALANKIPQIAVITNGKNEVYVAADKLKLLPPATQEKILRSLQIALNPKRIRVFEPNELARLMADGRLGDPPAKMSMSIVGGDGGGLGMHSLQGAVRGEKASVYELDIDPEKPIIIGQQNGGAIPYLDPQYVSSNLMPSGAPVKRGEKDELVSRAHFMMKADPRGIVIVNGVPREDGTIRAPKNGTKLVYPENRDLGDREEYLVKKGQKAKIKLPNGTVLEIKAD